MDLTIVIPTNRTPEKYVNRVIENINAFPMRYSYEIAVMSKEEVTGKNVRWVKEEKPIGPINAFNHVVANSDSQYFIFMVDDHIFYNNPSGAVDLLKERYSDRRFPIASLSSGPQSFNPSIGQRFGATDLDFEIPLYPLCKFPAFDRRVLKELGGHVFHPKLYYHAADILLGFYMGMSGEPSNDLPILIRPHNPAKDSSHEVNDCEIVKSIIKKYVNGSKKYLS